MNTRTHTRVTDRERNKQQICYDKHNEQIKFFVHV